MPRYQLFAARDGETVSDQGFCADDDAAETWAAERIVEAFDLTGFDDAEFYEVVAETDGVDLTIVEPDPVGKFAMEWLVGQLTVSTALADHFGDRFAQQIRSFRGGLFDLLLALQADQVGEQS